MSIAWHRYLDIHLAAPSEVHTHRARDTQRGSAAVLPTRRGDGLSTSLRRSFSRWLRASAPLGGRSQRLTFGVRADTPSTRQTARTPMPFASPSLSDGADGDVSSEFPLSHVRVLGPKP